MLIAILLTALTAASAPQGPSSFAYVLQAEAVGQSRGHAVAALASVSRDWIILDPAYTDQQDWTPQDIAAIRSGRPGRKVFAYLSIGEAENYRSYWQTAWDADKNGQPDPAPTTPQWLCDENPDWQGNFKVKYWHPEWQDITLHRVDALIQQGFDGVYLDIVDAFEFFEFDPATKDWIDHRLNPETQHTYRQDMVAWVRRIADRGRAARPGFMVIPQNGAQLAEEQGYIPSVDGIGVEDLFTDGDKAQPSEHTRYIGGFLKQFSDAGLPVLLIEYPEKPALRRMVQAKAQQAGYVLLLTDRALKSLGHSPLDKPAADDR